MKDKTVNNFLDKALNVLALALVVLFIVISMQGMAGAYELASVDITAQNQFTDTVRIDGVGLVVISDTGTFTGTVTLQVSADGGTTWADVKTWTAEDAESISNGCKQYYRLGVKTGDFTSGTATLYLIEGNKQ